MVVRLAKKKFFERELIANQTNLKKTWELIRTAANLPKANREGISQMLVDGTLVGDPLTIATKFNEHFVTMPAAIVSGIPPPAQPFDVDHDPPPPAHPIPCSVLITIQSRGLRYLKLLKNSNPKNLKTPTMSLCSSFQKFLNKLSNQFIM
jgi:hypothetical protein